MRTGPDGRFTLHHLTEDALRVDAKATELRLVLERKAGVQKKDPDLPPGTR